MKWRSVAVLLLASSIIALANQWIESNESESFLQESPEYGSQEGFGLEIPDFPDEEPFFEFSEEEFGLEAPHVPEERPVYAASEDRSQSEEISEDLINEEIVSFLPLEYDPTFVQLVEMVYGNGLLSQGGLDSIDELFSDIDINGLKVLDLGSGLGMYDLHLAKHHNVEIIGVDPQLSMVEGSLRNLEMFQDQLQGSVSFVLLQNSYRLTQFGDETFDLVFSKESILHVPPELKGGYFKEIYRVLKPEGRILLLDWMKGPLFYRGSTEKMLLQMNNIPYYVATPLEYDRLLRKSGFKEIIFEDETPQHIKFSQENIVTIMAKAKEIKMVFGVEIFRRALESWIYQRDAFAKREFLAGVFKAKKETNVDR